MANTCSAVALIGRLNGCRDRADGWGHGRRRHLPIPRPVTGPSPPAVRTPKRPGGRRAGGGGPGVAVAAGLGSVSSNGGVDALPRRRRRLDGPPADRPRAPCPAPCASPRSATTASSSTWSAVPATWALVDDAAAACSTPRLPGAPHRHLPRPWPACSRRQRRPAADLGDARRQSLAGGGRQAESRRLGRRGPPMRHRGRPLVVGITPGVGVALTLSLGDALATGLALAAAAAALRRWAWMTVALVAGVLTRETLLLVALGLVFTAAMPWRWRAGGGRPARRWPSGPGRCGPPPRSASRR